MSCISIEHICKLVYLTLIKKILLRLATLYLIDTYNNSFCGVKYYNNTFVSLQNIENIFLFLVIARPIIHVYCKKSWVIINWAKQTNT